MKKPKNSRSAPAATAVFVVVIISEARFFFREKQEAISEQKRQLNLVVVPAAAKSAAVPTTRAIPADANTNLTIGDIVSQAMEKEGGKQCHGGGRLYADRVILQELMADLKDSS